MKSLNVISTAAATLILTVFLSTAANAQQASGPSQGPLGSLGMFAPMILVFGIFYLLMIRPQQKQRKEQQAMINTLKKGDEVVTTAGIYGKIYAVMDNIVSMEIADNVRRELDKPQ